MIQRGFWLAWLSLYPILVSSLSLSLPHGWHGQGIAAFHRVCVTRQRCDREPSGDARRLVHGADGIKICCAIVIESWPVPKEQCVQSGRVALPQTQAPALCLNVLTLKSCRKIMKIHQTCCERRSVQQGCTGIYRHSTQMLYFASHPDGLSDPG